MPAGRPPQPFAVESGRPARRGGRSRGPLVLVAALATAALATACESKPPPTDTRVVGVSSSSPEPFQEMRILLTRLGRARDARDGAAGRAMLPEVLRASRSLLTMPAPNDLKRENATRFLEGRAQFTDRVNSFARAAGGADDAALWSASRELDSSFWSWFDAYRGRPSEGAV